MDTDEFFGTCILAFFPAVAWYYLLSIVNGEAVGDIHANRVFFSALLGFFGAWGTFVIWEAYGGWKTLFAGAIVGILTTALLTTNYPRDLPVSNYLLGSIYSVFMGLSVGTLAIALWASVAILISQKQWHDHLNRLAKQNKANADAQSQFKKAFDGDFDYDDSALKAKPKPKPRRKPAPRGYEKRHPDDAKYWAFIDDPNASDQERKTALEMILKAQAKRNGKTTKTKRVTSRK